MLSSSFLGWLLHCSLLLCLSVSNWREFGEGSMLYHGRANRCSRSRFDWSYISASIIHRLLFFLRISSLYREHEGLSLSDSDGNYYRWWLLSLYVIQEGFLGTKSMWWGSLTTPKNFSQPFALRIGIFSTHQYQAHFQLTIWKLVPTPLCISYTIDNILSCTG